MNGCEEYARALHFASYLPHLCACQFLSGVILEVLAEEYSDVMTAEVAGAWTKLLATIYTSITTTYVEVGWTTLSSSTG